MPQLSMAGTQGRKIGPSLKVGGMAYSLSPVKHSDTSQSYVEEGR